MLEGVNFTLCILYVDKSDFKKEYRMYKQWMCTARFLIPHIHKYKEIHKFVNVYNLIFIIIFFNCLFPFTLLCLETKVLLKLKCVN